MKHAQAYKYIHICIILKVIYNSWQNNYLFVYIQIWDQSIDEADMTQIQILKPKIN